MNLSNQELEPVGQLIKRLEVLIENFPQGSNPSVTWLDISETARWLKVSPRTLQNYRDKGLIPYSQIAAKIYFRLQDLQEFLMKNYVGRFPININQGKSSN